MRATVVDSIKCPVNIEQGDFFTFSPDQLALAWNRLVSRRDFNLFAHKMR